MGRKSKFRPEFCEQAKKLTLLGAIDRDLADFFHVAESAINRWKLEHEDFAAALKLGKAEADERVVESLFRRATGYSHAEEKVFNNQGEIITHETVKHYPPDSTAMIFWLKNRMSDEWRDIQEHGGKVALEVEAVSDVEIARRIAFLLTKDDHTTH